MLDSTSTLPTGRTRTESTVGEPSREVIRAFDMFCGGGGSSTGMAQACDEFGVGLQLSAVNHWNVAIATHERNHPNARHRCANVDEMRLDELAPEGVDVLWASPSCTEHSYAKGGSSIDDQKRASAWAVPRAIEAWRPKVVIVENVRPFLKWGPVEPVVDRKTEAQKLDKKGRKLFRPIKARRGETFRAWFSAIESLGYQGKWELLNAADYGEPQTRLRLFVVFTAHGYEFDYPMPTHGKIGTLEVERGLRKPWEPARKIIDFSLKSESIFARKDPLSPNTMKRIEAGIRRYCKGALAEAFLVVLRNHADAQSLEAPSPTVAANGQHLALAQTEMRPFVGGNRMNNVPVDLEDPSPTVTTAHGGGLYLAEPEAFLVSRHNDSDGKERRPHDLDDPSPTVTGSGAGYLVEPQAFTLGQHTNSAPRDVDDPLSTVTTHGYTRLFEPTALVLGQHGGGIARSVDEPLSTISCAGYVRVFEPMVVDVRHGDRPHQPRSVDDPLGTVTGRNGAGVVEPFIASYYGDKGGEGRTRAIDEPLPTIPTENRFAVVEPFIVPQANASPPCSTDDPLPTITTTSRGVRLVQPYLVANFGERKTQDPRTHSIDEPVPCVTSRGAGDLVEAEAIAVDPDVPADRVVIVDGKPYLLDIKFRMLQPAELARAQGFPDDYKFEGTKEARTMQIGNAVPVAVAKHLMYSALRAVYGSDLGEIAC